MSLSSNVFDTALIFEGGAMRASYTAPVVNVLLKNDIYFDWTAGISAGSTNTVNYVSRDSRRARLSFTDFAGDPNFGNFRTFLRGEGLFNANYIYQQTSGPDEALPFNSKVFFSNPARLRIGGFNAETGETAYWGREDLSTNADIMKKVQASSTMPGLMPVVDIDGVQWVDGAIGSSGGVALDAAEADGFERFLVIMTRPRNYWKSVPRNTKFFERHFRKYPAVAEALITRHVRYNATKEKLLELEKHGRAVLFFPENMMVGTAERNINKLRANYIAGLDQAKRDLPIWKDFVGL
ncbi:patatin family protein [Flaviflexus ciconiae]|uniref:Patatin family protein n=1 Tax=Flaviflexus ciconiae TaxID=2496867 RepID=A0A3Q9G2I7_9ACTO|nr:patatin family protein [Flaviflexus ciconiae]AZQ75949.1 patatin family protein [Flaviflexus ciconiae]